MRRPHPLAISNLSQPLPQFTRSRRGQQVIILILILQQVSRQRALPKPKLRQQLVVVRGHRAEALYSDTRGSTDGRQLSIHQHLGGVPQRGPVGGEW